MAKISTYPVVTPQGSDIIVGSDASDSNNTKNFTVQSIIDLAPAPVGAQDLQDVLDQGNTATQSINLDGRIVASRLEVDPANILPVAGEGQMAWSVDRETVEVGLHNGETMFVGQDDLWLARAGENISKGMVLYASGTTGASGRIIVNKFIADGTIPGRLIMGVAHEDAPTGTDFYVMSRGKIRQLNTSAFTDGDVLWASSTLPGGLTKVQPTAPGVKAAIAFVVHAAVNGTIAVRSETGAEVAEASDVQITGVSSGQFLTYDAAGFWANRDADMELLGGPGSVDGSFIVPQAITDVVGSDPTFALGKPAVWLEVTLSGGKYVIPLYPSA